MHGQRLRYGAAVAALVLASCFLYLVPLVSSVVLDVIISDNGSGTSPFILRTVESIGGRDFVRANLWIAVALIFGLTTFAGLFTYLRGRWAAEATERIIRGLRDRLYDQLQHLPCSYYDGAETGDLIQRCTSDVETVRQFLLNQVVEIGRAALMLLVPLPLMYAIDPRMTGVSLILIPPIVGFSVVFFQKVRHRFEEVDKAEGRLTSTLQENLTGIRVVRAFARQEYEIRKFGARNGNHRDLDYRLYRLLATFWSTSDFLCMAQIALVVFTGGVWLASGSLSVGSFFFFLSVVNMFIWPVRMMGRILTELGKATVAIGRIQEILGHERESTPIVANTTITPADQRGEIVFDRVTFSHRDGTCALQDVSFRVAPGSTLALLGPSGSGKSTVVNLLLRLYDHAEGSIQIDGHNIANLDRKAVRRRISVVMQEPFLYSKSVRANLMLGHPTATHEEIATASASACVHDTIMEFEGGYETIVGERGITLSGGQRQRVALARALLKEPLILALDDALSAVDSETESLILAALKSRRGRHTTIVIAHRLSTLMHADEILVFDRGRIIQRGTHNSLKEEAGLYSRIWKMQTENI
ncbi:MAG: ABC transporter ATP-binding protein [Acidobacteria bacterium]|nr:MAG: ABC transporter ATP-binding protein [Acidobacteriota bacterium]